MGLIEDMKKDPKKPKYITLKEAAQISNYSPDYLGYLIREGKISGKQVYCNVAWVTTKEAVLEYKQRKEKGEEIGGFREKIQKIKGRILGEIEILKLFLKTSRYFLSVIIILIFSFAGLLFYFFSARFEETEAYLKTPLENAEKTQEDMTY